GNMLQLLLSYRYGDYEFRWQKLYGALYRVKGCFGEDRLVVSDPMALQFMVNNANKFGHSPMNSHAFVEFLFGKKNIMSVKGDDISSIDILEMCKY
ncbi:hypothetical protein FB45DRAFT_743650, partial [Roridomyces roridus]